MAMSDTPRTDALMRKHMEVNATVVRAAEDLAEHSCQLEHELQEAKGLLRTVLKENGINTLGRIKIEMFLESEAGE
jgi:hypothetical protein